MKTILMTGAAGRIGTFLRPELAPKYKLRLSDIKPIRDLRPGETFMHANISKLSDMLQVTKGVDAVVHFGGQSGEHDWDHILSANIIGFYNARGGFHLGPSAVAFGFGFLLAVNSGTLK